MMQGHKQALLQSLSACKMSFNSSSHMIVLKMCANHAHLQYGAYQAYNN